MITMQQIPTGNSSAVTKVTKLQQFPASAVPPEAERILRAFDDAHAKRGAAVQATFICGLLMCEQRDKVDGAESHDRTKPEHSKFAFWMEKYCGRIPRSTAYKWMDFAERVCRHSQEKLGDGPTAIPLSMALTAPEAELPKKALELRQSVFLFMEGKTMKECLEAVAADGDEAHRITRAHNGRNARGAGGGGNRKNFTGFLAVKLRHATTFLNQKLSNAEQAKMGASLCAAIQKWPRWAVQMVADQAKAEMKLSDEERAGRKLK